MSQDAVTQGQESLHGEMGVQKDVAFQDLMSDDLMTRDSHTLSHDDARSQTLGGVLQNLREQSGLDIPALATVMKVSARKIEALEQNRLEELPDLVFARGLVSSICRFYKVDAQAVLGLMPKAKDTKEFMNAASVQEKFPERSRDRWGALSSMLSPSSLMLALLLLVGALVIIFLPHMEKSADKPKSVATRIDSNTSTSPAVAGSNSSNNAAVDLNANLSSSQPSSGQVTQTNAATTTAQLPTGGAAVASSSTVNGVGNTAAPSSTTATSGGGASSTAALGVLTSPTTAAATKAAIVFQSSGDSWVSVRQLNENGKSTKTLFNGMVKAGETIPVEALAPYAVTVGRSDVMKVQVKGQNYDLAAISKGNQARFTIKE